MLKNGLKGFAIGFAVLALALVAVGLLVAGPMFIGNKPLRDGEALPNGGVVVVDKFVAIDVLDAGEGQGVLIDCGDDFNGEALLKTLEAKKLIVKAIFLTHGHPDHIGGCHLFPQAEVYGFREDAKLAAVEERGKGPGPSHMDIPKERATKITHYLADGEPVTIGTLTLKPYAIPGHTAGSAAYLVNGILFLGDAAMVRADGKTLKAAAWVVSDDQAQGIASLKTLHARVKGETVTHLAPAHTGMTPNVDALLGVD